MPVARDPTPPRIMASDGAGQQQKAADPKWAAAPTPRAEYGKGAYPRDGKAAGPKAAGKAAQHGKGGKGAQAGNPEGLTPAGQMQPPAPQLQAQ